MKDDLSLTSTGRIQSITIMRVLAMFMILQFHSLCFYTHRWWSMGGEYIPLWDKLATLLDSIDLPMFVYISGYLFSFLFIHKRKYRNRQNFYWTKIKRLLVPYIIWGILLNIIMASIHEWSSLLTGISHLWFLLMLFELFAITYPFITYICKNANKANSMLLLLLSFFIYATYHILSNHHSFLCIETTLYYLPYFLFGMISVRFLPFKDFIIKYASLILFISIGLLFLYLFLISSLPFIINYIVLFLISTTIIETLFSIFDSKVNSKFINSISHLDKLSMGIYIFNQIVIDAFILIDGVVPFLNNHSKVGPLIIFIIGTLLSFYLSKLFNNSKYLRWTIGY